MLALRVETGDLRGRVVPVERELVVGRATTCDLAIADQRLSRRHARFFVEAGELFVEDLGSPNGTIVNQRRITRTKLTNGDTIVLGKTQLRVDTSGEDVTLVPGAKRPVSMSRGERHEARLIKPIESTFPPALTRMPAAEFYTALGLGQETQLDARKDVHDVVLRRARSFAILHEVSRAIQNERDPREMLSHVLDLVLKVTEADRGYVALMYEDGELDVEVSRSREGASSSAVVLSHTVSEQVIGRRCAVIVADPTADERFQGSESLMLSETRSLMAVPIVIQTRVLGLIQVESGHVGERFTEHDLDLLSMIASTAGVALDNLQLALARELTIRELEEAQAQLLSAQERLVKSEQLAAIGRLAAGIAHEVKNQLSPFALADMIAKKYPGDASTREAAEMMREAQQHILDLVNEVRDFARGGPSTHELAPHDVAELVERVLQFLRCDKAVSRAKIELEVEAKPIVELDPRSFRQVLINLVKNAVDALPERAGRVRVRVTEEDDWAIIDVEDNGTGIPAEVAQHLFQPFFTTKGDKGLGLGLDISRKIIQAHKGDLTFASEPGETTFRIAVPIAGA
jgi:signal transduction histidine kinase/pSer/pThr/pTyr-binding forkhead associated (FHA) protein